LVEIDGFAAIKINFDAEVMIGLTAQDVVVISIGLKGLLT